MAATCANIDPGSGVGSTDGDTDTDTDADTDTDTDPECTGDLECFLSFPNIACCDNECVNPLLDLDNCGTCGYSCVIACLGGECIPF